jgi:RNA polymerase sigma factor (sigma-70 family)
MDASVPPGSPAVSRLYFPLVDRESPERVLPEIAKATSFLARGFARRTIPYEDLQQEGLLACVLAARTFDVARGASFPTYALHCARSRMLDYVRREKRASKGIDSGDAVLDDETNDTLFDRLPYHPAFLENPENHTLASQLNTAISRLPERERVCIDLFFHEELTHEEIAARLGVRRARVGQLVGQAISRLRKALVQ